MFVTGDTTAYRAMTPGCVPCAKLADRIEGYYAAGGWVKAKPWRVVSIKLVRNGKRDQTYYVDTEIPPAVVRDSSEHSPIRLPSGRPLLAPRLKRDGAIWVMTDYVEISR